MAIKEYVGCILLNKDKEILLQKKTKDYKYPGCWSLFGGSIEANETPEQAIIRELKEEIGIDFNINNLKFFKEVICENKKEKLKFGVFTSEFNKNISEIKIGEGCGVAFFAIEEVQNLNLMFDTIGIINEYFNYKK